MVLGLTVARYHSQEETMRTIGLVIALAIVAYVLGAELLRPLDRVRADLNNALKIR